MSRNSFAILLPAVGLWTLFCGCSKETASVAATEATPPASDYLAEGNEEFKKYFGDVCEVVFSYGSFVRSDFESNFDRATKWVQEAQHPLLTPYIFAYTLATMRGQLHKFELQQNQDRGNRRSEFKHDLIGVSVYFIVVRLAAAAQSDPIRDKTLAMAQSIAKMLSTDRSGWLFLKGNVVNVSTICKDSMRTAGDNDFNCRATVFKARQLRLLSNFLAHGSTLSGDWRALVIPFFDTDALTINQKRIMLSAAASKQYLNCLRILANELDTLVPGSVGNAAAMIEFKKSRDAVFAEVNPGSATTTNHLSTTS